MVRGLVDYPDLYLVCQENDSEERSKCTGVICKLSTYRKGIKTCRGKNWRRQKIESTVSGDDRGGVIGSGLEQN